MIGMTVALPAAVVVTLASEMLEAMVRFVPGIVTLASCVTLRRVMFDPGAAVISEMEWQKSS
jgi:hypothetical protein